MTYPTTDASSTALQRIHQPVDAPTGRPLVQVFALNGDEYEIHLELGHFATAILRGLRYLATDDSDQATIDNLRLRQILNPHTPSADAARLIEQLAADTMLQASLNALVTPALVTAYAQALAAVEPPQRCVYGCSNFADTCEIDHATQKITTGEGSAR